MKHFANAKALSAVWFSQQKCTGFFLTYVNVMEVIDLSRAVFSLSSTACLQQKMNMES